MTVLEAPAPPLPASPSPSMGPAASGFIGAAAGLALVGMLVLALVPRAHRPLRADQPVAPTVVYSADAAQAFVAAWKHSLTSSWAIEQAYERVTPQGTLRFTVRRAQRPPDSLDVGLGTIQARRGDTTLACVTGASAQLHCRSAGTAASYDVTVASAMDILRTQVLGPSVLYDVGAGNGPGCYALRLRLPDYPAPPYGRRAEYCFDAATGAPLRSVVERAAGTDTARTVATHAPAVDADLAPPPDDQVIGSAPAPPAASLSTTTTSRPG